MARPRANSAPYPSLDVLKQKTRVVIDAQIERDIKTPATDFSQTLHALKWLIAP